tara:strand:+ start:15127 stop:16368 length:1242 start_codon:yes stop_codon:yes gene_type:complete
MDTALKKKTSNIKKNIWVTLLTILIAAIVIIWYNQKTEIIKNKNKQKEIIQIVSTVVKKHDIPIRLTANGTVVSQQTVEVRPQISAIVKNVHIKEGQFVHKGDKLFTLDARTESANLNKAEAQLARSNADFANALRNLNRQKKLFEQKFISQAALDIAQKDFDSLKGKLDFDKAFVQESHVAHGFTIITAPISGRTGSIPVHPGSLVQPNIAIPGSVTQPRSAVLVSITQINPINIKFTLPEHKLLILQKKLTQGDIVVNAKLDVPGEPLIKGRLIFIDNAVDTKSGSILIKAEFPNKNKKLWPGMFVTVMLSPEIFIDALTVPVQAVQTGPENKFLYVIEENNKVKQKKIIVHLVQDGIAVIEGTSAGTKIVVEGGQNLKPGSTVIETQSPRNKSKSNNNVLNNYIFNKMPG